MKKKLFITTLTLAAIFLVGGCGQSTAAETTAPAEETAEAEAETVPTPEPSPTAEPTPEPVVELADDEILQAAHDAFMAQNKFTVTEIFYDEDLFDMERTIYVDFDKNLITYNAPDLFSSVCANSAMLVKGDEDETYFLTDKGWYGTSETLSNFSYEAYTNIIESFFAREEPACGFYNMELGYTVTHDFTSDLVNPEDYYLLEQFDTTTFSIASLYYYTAYYINKSTLLPDYVISQSFYGEDTVNQTDESGSTVAFNGDPMTTHTCHYEYIDDTVDTNSEVYKEWSENTTVPAAEELMSVEEVSSYITEYADANPNLQIWITRN